MNTSKLRKLPVSDLQKVLYDIHRITSKVKDETIIKKIEGFYSRKHILTELYDLLDSKHSTSYIIYDLKQLVKLEVLENYEIEIKETGKNRDIIKKKYIIKSGNLFLDDKIADFTRWTTPLLKLRLTKLYILVLRQTKTKHILIKLEDIINKY